MKESIRKERKRRGQKEEGVRKKTVQPPSGETETSSQKGAAPCATILDTITLWAQFP